MNLVQKRFLSAVLTLLAAAFLSTVPSEVAMAGEASSPQTTITTNAPTPTVTSNTVPKLKSLTSEQRQKLLLLTKEHGKITPLIPSLVQSLSLPETIGQRLNSFMLVVKLDNSGYMIFGTSRRPNCSEPRLTCERLPAGLVIATRPRR